MIHFETWLQAEKNTSHHRGLVQTFFYPKVWQGRIEVGVAGTHVLRDPVKHVEVLRQETEFYSGRWPEGAQAKRLYDLGLIEREYATLIGAANKAAFDIRKASWPERDILNTMTVTISMEEACLFRNLLGIAASAEDLMVKAEQRQCDPHVVDAEEASAILMGLYGEHLARPDWGREKIERALTRKIAQAAENVLAALKQGAKPARKIDLTD